MSFGVSHNLRGVRPLRSRSVTATSIETGHPSARSNLICTLVLAVAVVAVTIDVLARSRHATFFFDEWNYLEYRSSGGVGSFLAPYNGNLVAGHVALYRLLLPLVGVGRYWPYQLVALTGNALAAYLLYRYARTRTHVLVALSAALVLVTFGTGWEVIVWGDGGENYAIGLAACLLGTLLLLDRSSRRCDWMAAGVLAVSLALYAPGMAIAAGVATELVMRREYRRLAPFALPVAAYGVWFAALRSMDVGGVLSRPGSVDRYASGASSFGLDNLGHAPSFLLHNISGAAGALVGQTETLGYVVLLTGVAAVIVRLRVRAHPAPARLANVAVTTLASWFVLSFARAQFDKPLSPRYLYATAFLLLVLSIELVRGVRLTRVALLGVGVASVIGIVSNVGELHDGADRRDVAGEIITARVTAVLLAGPGVDPSYEPQSEQMPSVTAGALARVNAHFGGLRTVDLAHASTAERSAADEVLIGAQRLALRDAGVPAVGGPAPEMTRVDGGSVTVRDACMTGTPNGEMIVELRAPAPGIVVGTRGGDGPHVALARYGPFRPLVGSTTARVPYTLRIPADGSATPWTVRIKSTTPFEVCALAP